MTSKAWVLKSFLQANPDSFLTTSAVKRLQYISKTMTEDDVNEVMDLARMVARWDYGKSVCEVTHVEIAQAYIVTGRLEKMKGEYETRRVAWAKADRSE